MRVLLGLAGVGLPLIAVVLFFSTGRANSAGPASEYNSQTLPVLVAVLNPDASGRSRGGGDIAVVGNSALLAETGPAGTVADLEAPKSDKISVYVVRPGDTLSQIAEMFNVTTNTIAWANDISRGNSIQPGQTLVILPVSGVRHKVADGDTLKGIAKKYGGDLDEILLYNHLEAGSALSVGDVVIVPDGEIESPKSAPTYSAPKSLAGGSSSGGVYLRPIDGGIVSQGLHGYNGVDLDTYGGAPIYAAAAGQVIISRCGWNGGYGCYIVIDHANGAQTLYAHNSENIVYGGQSVVPGQVIGYVGNTGRSTGSHLHFEVRGGYNPFQR